MTVTADQVGKLYDILIATRDGSTLACQDHNGRTQQVSQVAYMLSTTKPSSEATELQRKEELTRFSSAQITDVYFDAWPQVEQGDWSDGMGQRVFSGQGEALGTVSNKSTRYWDGLGLIWPITDYLPQQPVLATADQAEAGAIMLLAGNGVTGGQFSAASNGSGFVYAYMQNAAPQHNIIVLQTSTTRTKLDPMPGSTNGAPFISCDYVIAANSIWYAYDSGGSVIQIATLFPTVNQTTIPNAQMNSGSTLGRIAVGLVAGRLYFAITYVAQAGANVNQAVMKVFDITLGTWTSSTAEILLGNQSANKGTPQQIEFMGDNILISIAAGQASNINQPGGFTGGSEAILTQYNIPSQTLSTLASFQGVNRLWFRPIAGGVFILASDEAVINGFPNTIDMYLLQGGGLQHIGPVQVQATTQGASNVITGTTEPVAFGPYAIFPIYYLPVGSTNTRVATFAYDVLRGRLFKLSDIGNYDQFLGNGHGCRCGLTPSLTRPVGALTLAAQWDVIVPTLSNNGSATNVTNAQEMLIGVSNGAFQPFLQTGVQITSSLIDFTSAQNKLYRQLVADFTPLPNDAAITVQLDCWFDQDPAALAAVPDFTTGAVAGSGSNVGLRQLRLVTNKIARKVVYRVTTTGPSATPTGAVKVISVKTQVATGWALHYFLDIARNAQCNDSVDGQATYCFDNQRPVDDYAAHAFLKQLWRLKGGECIVTLPTGETYNALLQLISAENVKHVIQSGLSDTPVVKSVLVELKIREDV